MSNLPHNNREAILRRLRVWIDHFKADSAQYDAECIVTFDGVPQTGDGWNEIRFDEMTMAELLAAEEEFKALAVRLAFMETSEFQLQMEHLCFAAHICARQGTHMPDFDAFYHEREELDRRFGGSPDRGH